MFYQRMDFNGNNIGTIRSLNNSIPVQEAFMLNSHGKIIVGGVRGGYSAAYTYASQFLPLTGEGDADSRTEPFAEVHPLNCLQVSVNNSRPIFEYPASRVFSSELDFESQQRIGECGRRPSWGALLRVVSMTGAVVLEREIQPGETLLQLDLSTVGKGLYGVEMLGKSSVTSRKIVVE